MTGKREKRMKRNIITIDQEKCNGCGICASACPEGALQVIDGKARLVGDLLCDGLGACLSSCPEDAITIVERDAEPYNEIEVIKNIIPQGNNVILAHLQHLKSHYQTADLNKALTYLRQNKVSVALPPEFSELEPAATQCPGSRTQAFKVSKQPIGDYSVPSQLTHWPVQLHLISPMAPHYRNADLLVSADCVAYALADFHKDYLKDKKLVIACPKLDVRQEVYAEKLTALIDQAEVKSVRVMIMQVPCCSGLLRQVIDAASRAKRSVPVSCVIVGITGDIMSETPIEIESAVIR
jgi:NAD-dependent dihydropyrimidine dehydrogenase PreA subunit